MMELAPNLPEMLRCEVRRRLAELDAHPGRVLDFGELLDEQSALVALLAALLGGGRRYTDLGGVLLPADHALLANWQPATGCYTLHVHDGRRSPRLDGPLATPQTCEILLVERLGEGPCRLRVDDEYLAVSCLHPRWVATWRQHGVKHPVYLADHRRLTLLPAGVEVRVG
jgi:hypothetical protein